MDLNFIIEKIPLLKQGYCAELPEIAEDSKAWPLVTATAQNCLNFSCPEIKKCFFYKARADTQKADITIVNHHLFFADANLQSNAILPQVDVAIFDEAHQLPEIAQALSTKRLGTKQFLELVDNIIKAWPALDISNQPFKELYFELEQIFNQISFVLPLDKLSWKQATSYKTFKDLWLKFENQTHRLLDIIADDPEAMANYNIATDFMNTFLKDPNFIPWVENFKSTTIFHATPYCVDKLFSKIFPKNKAAQIFTSATLTVAQNFQNFKNQLGLHSSQTTCHPSPFDYKKQALFYLPRYLPEPAADDFYEKLIAHLIPVFKASQGRCFFLFTSLNALNKAAKLLEGKINLPILVQGTQSKNLLLKQFCTLKNAILLGSATFWEGVDVVGDTLSCVVIDKLPFMNHKNPLNYAKIEFLRKQGLSPFTDHTLPDAIISLKQGVGRLIRDITDKGLLVVADNRLVSREYGRVIFESLPDIPKTRDKNKALRFLESL